MAGDRFVARYSPVKVGLLAAFLIGLIVVFAWVPWRSFEPGSGEDAMRWAIVAACILGLILALRKLFDDRPQIHIDRDGLFCRAWSDVVIPWSAVADFRFERERIGDRRRIYVRLHDLAAYPARSRFGGAWVARDARRYEGLVIMTRLFDRNAEAVMNAMIRFAPPGLAAPEERFW